MIIKKFSRFTESLGIDKNIEEQAKSIFNEIMYSKESKFTFWINNEDKKYKFELEIAKDIDDLESVQGRFIITNDDKMKILLRKRNDYPTLLHEMKHLSRYIKNNGTHFNHFINKTHKVLNNDSKIKKDNPLFHIKNIFYVYDTDEFEAKYHGYYAAIDNHIKLISDLKKQSPIDKSVSKDFIVDSIKIFLDKSDDKSYTWWVGYFNNEKCEEIFTFSTYISEDIINKLFYIVNKDVIDNKSYTNMFKEIYLDLKDSLKLKFNIFSKKDKIEINKTRKRFEAEINKRKRIFAKKFYRIFTIMVDKYADK